MTRQYATAFNQPLSLDTSSVTDMSYMFSMSSYNTVRLPPPACAVHPAPGTKPVPPCTLRAPALPPHSPSSHDSV